MKINAKKAFTLAEVLISVSIIGVIASLVIPSLIAGNQSMNNQYVNGLRQTYANLLTAGDQIKARNAGTFIGSYVTTNDNFRDAFSNGVKFVEICNLSDSDKTKCWPSNFTNLGGGAPELALMNRYNFRSSIAVLNDGTMLVFIPDDVALADGTVSCTGGWVVNKTGNDISCGEILVDVNGFNSPNRFGRDIFKFYVTQDKILPEGELGTKTHQEGITCPDTNPVHGTNGLECTATVLKTGKMLY